MNRRRLAVAVAALVVGCGDDDAGKRPELIVSAAASMKEALTTCAPRFGDEESARVRLSFAGSDELAAQIRRGARIDAYAAANTKLPDQLHAEQLLDRPVVFATNELVLAVPEGSRITELRDLAEAGTKLVLGAESVPVGAYARETLSRLPPAQEQAILGNVRSNEPDVRGIVGKLAQGAADAGFVYATDVEAAGGKLEAIALPAGLEPEVAYAAGAVSDSGERELARRFVEGLRGGTCARFLRDAGFGPPP